MWVSRFFFQKLYKFIFLVKVLTLLTSDLVIIIYFFDYFVTLYLSIFQGCPVIGPEWFVEQIEDAGEAGVKKINFLL